MNRKKKAGTARSNKFQESIDMSPGEPHGVNPDDSHQQQRKGPHSIEETEAWRQGTSSLKNAWANYKRMLTGSWKRLPRAEQEALIMRFCQIITIGVSALGLMIFYPFLPQLVRLIAVPAGIAGAFFVGTKIVTPVITAHYNKYLNREF